MNRLLIVLFLLPCFLSAQQPDSTEVINRLQFGVGFGVMQHEVDFTPNADVEPLSGNSFNLGLRYFDNKLVGFQAELSYSQAGWIETIDTTFAGQYQRQTDYIELLILTQFSIGRGAFQPMFQAGPYLSFPLSSTEEIPTEYVAPTEGTPDYYGFDIPFRPNYGLQGGLGFNLELGKLTIQLEGRYLIGFNDLIKTGDTVASTSRRAGVGGHLGMFWAVGD
ncbi:porin family protein [Neolewinella agarilytica]|uniref:porin family protein n=1 Tax=Neolewinella agarilytica TaxID=478744 RepID=UPI0023521492|nr:porin family protein [Neolewinella agarilytica]